MRRRRVQLEDYLVKRTREDILGDESGLLTIKPIHNFENGSSKPLEARDELLGHAVPGSALGAAQVHEELSGQLADVSYLFGVIEVYEILFRCQSGLSSMRFTFQILWRMKNI